MKECKKQTMSQGEFLRYLREECKLSKVALAKRVGVTPRTISNWEKNKPIDPCYLPKLCEVLKTSPEEIKAGTFSLCTRRHFNDFSKILLELIRNSTPAEAWNYLMRTVQKKKQEIKGKEQEIKNKEQEIKDKEQEIDDIKKEIDEIKQHIEQINNARKGHVANNTMKAHERTSIPEISNEELVDLALSVDREGCFEFLKEYSSESFDNEKDIAENYYSNPDDYDPEIGLDTELMDETTLKEAILMIINDCQNPEENGIHTSLEDAEKLLNSGLLSSTAIENMTDKLDQTKKVLENQEITLNAQDMEKMFGLDLALSNFPHSLDE